MKKTCLKNFCAAVIAFIMLMPTCVSAENPYGLSDESTQFLKKYDVDFSVLEPLFGENSTEETLPKVEEFLRNVKITNELSGNSGADLVHGLVKSNVLKLEQQQKMGYAYLPKCNVTLNGVEIDNDYRQYPLLQYRDIVYFPMTYHDCRFLGVAADWLSEPESKLVVKKENILYEYYGYPSEDKNADSYEYDYYSGYGVNVATVEINGKKILSTQEAEYPFLTFREVIYFPLTWELAHDELGWEYSYDDENGLVINSTNEEEQPEESDNEFRVIGYYSGDLFDEPLENLQTDKLTHIMYAFLIPQKDGSCVPFENPDKVKALVEKAHKDGCKVYIAVGGWSYKDVPLVTTFEAVAANDILRKKFIGNVMDIVDEYGFDGVELDWEYPSKASEKNYEKLILELHEKLREKDKHITAALNGAWSATQGPEVSNYVSEACLDAFEFINVMSYDMNNEQHSPFWFANTSIDYWLTRGVTADKIVLGMPLYARPSWMQYRHLVAENAEFAYSDYAKINGNDSHYNGLPTLCKKTILAKEKAGGVMLFDVNEDTNDESSVVSMIDDVVNQLEQDGHLSGNTAEILKKGGAEELTAITGKTYVR